MRREALRWLDEAMWDLDTARILHEAERFNAAAFYAHQAAEKASKACYIMLTRPLWGIVLGNFYSDTLKKLLKTPKGNDAMRQGA